MCSLLQLPLILNTEVSYRNSTQCLQWSDEAGFHFFFEPSLTWAPVQRIWVAHRIENLCKHLSVQLVLFVVTTKIWVDSCDKSCRFSNWKLCEEKTRSQKRGDYFPYVSLWGTEIYPSSTRTCCAFISVAHSLHKEAIWFRRVSSHRCTPMKRWSGQKTHYLPSQTLPKLAGAGYYITRARAIPPGIRCRLDRILSLRSKFTFAVIGMLSEDGPKANLKYRVAWWCGHIVLHLLLTRVVTGFGHLVE